jgi:general secretion pathway protein K
MTNRPAGEGARRGSDGFILVAVLWILGALATLVSVYSIYVSNTALALAVNDDTVRAEGLAAAAVELAVYQLLRVKEEERPTRGAFSFRMGRASIAVDFRSESSRVDLNEAPKELLAGLFGVLGAHPDDAARYADRIVGWRTKPGSGSPDREASLYRAAGLVYSPRGAPFAHADELWLVLDLPPALVERAMPYVTVYSGKAEVNVLDAAPEVVAALPGMTPERMSAFLARRGTIPHGSDAALTMLGPARTSAMVEGSDAVRVTTRIVFDNGRRLGAEAVVLIDGGSLPFRVLKWRNDIDAPARFAARAGTGAQR